MGEDKGASLSGITAGAIYNATGKWVLDYPLTPSKVLKALEKFEQTNHEDLQDREALLLFVVLGVFVVCSVLASHWLNPACCTSEKVRSMQTVTSIAPIILAAGDSTRMGYPKALLPLGPDTFLTRILGILRNVGLPKPVIILGRAAPTIRAQIKGWPAEIRINPDPSRGQLSSIQLALSHLSPECIAGLIWPVDQPAISEDLVRRLAQLFIDSRSKIVCPIHGGRRGHPAIFHRDLFQEFMDAPLEEGPKKILVRHQHATVLLSTEEPATVQDIDTPEEYRALTGESLDLALARLSAPDASQS